MKWKNIEQRRKYYQEWREKNKDKTSEYAKTYKRKRLKRDPKYITRNVNNWRERYPERDKAHRIVFSEVRRGNLFAEPCFCGETKTEAHHEDYSKPLEVVWLCKIHHLLADKNRRGV